MEIIKCHYFTVHIKSKNWIQILIRHWNILSVVTLRIYTQSTLHRYNVFWYVIHKFCAIELILSWNNIINYQNTQVFQLILLGQFSRHVLILYKHICVNVDKNTIVYFRRNAAPGVWLLLLLPCAIITSHFTCKTDSEPYAISTLLSFGLLVSAASNVLHCERFPAKPLGYIVTAAVIAQLLTLYTDLGKNKI